jgi:hypothetical protein
MSSEFIQCIHSYALSKSIEGVNEERSRSRQGDDTRIEIYSYFRLARPPRNRCVRDLVFGDPNRQPEALIKSRRLGSLTMDLIEFVISPVRLHLHLPCPQTHRGPPQPFHFRLQLFKRAFVRNPECYDSPPADGGMCWELRLFCLLW